MASAHEPIPPARRWFFGFVMAVFCSGIGAIVALVLDRLEGNAPSLWWVFGVSLVPSVVAGILLARNPKPDQGLGQDPLTGLFGKARLREMLEAEWARSKRLGKQVGLVMVELDQEGRMSVPQYVAWRTLARTLKSVVRLYDFSFVLNPGRFAVLLSATSADGGKAVIKRLRKAVQETPELYGVSIRYAQCVRDPALLDEVSENVLSKAMEEAGSAPFEKSVPTISKEILSK